LIDELTQSTHKWAQLIEGVHGEQGGVNVTNVGRTWMWSNQKMRCTALIHNDDARGFHMAVRGTHKLVTRGHINFEDHALIKRWGPSKNMNAMADKFKDERIGITIKSNSRLLLEVVRVFKVLEFIIT
jgi:hypothetical protein